MIFIGKNKAADVTYKNATNIPDLKYLENARRRRGRNQNKSVMI